jgi:methyl-accepting chemotaxis protein
VLQIVAENSRIANDVRVRADEVSASSSEQATGLKQIAQAVLQMQRVTQTTAANAEESASASEELSSQAKGLMELVAELEFVASGRR